MVGRLPQQRCEGKEKGRGREEDRGEDEECKKENHESGCLHYILSLTCASLTVDCIAVPCMAYKQLEGHTPGWV